MSGGEGGVSGGEGGGGEWLSLSRSLSCSLLAGEEGDTLGPGGGGLHGATGPAGGHSD